MLLLGSSRRESAGKLHRGYDLVWEVTVFNYMGYLNYVATRSVTGNSGADIERLKDPEPVYKAIRCPTYGAVESTKFAVCLGGHQCERACISGARDPAVEALCECRGG